jgi:hypothetical protein
MIPLVCRRTHLGTAARERAVRGTAGRCSRDGYGRRGRGGRRTAPRRRGASAGWEHHATDGHRNVPSASVLRTPCIRTHAELLPRRGRRRRGRGRCRGRCRRRLRLSAAHAFVTQPRHSAGICRARGSMRQCSSAARVADAGAARTLFCCQRGGCSRGARRNCFERLLSGRGCRIVDCGA